MYLERYVAVLQSHRKTCHKNSIGVPKQVSDAAVTFKEGWCPIWKNINSPVTTGKNNGRVGCKFT